MIETGKITNFILLIKEELRENMGGILAMVLGVLAALYTIWLTLTYLPAEPFPSVVTPTPITAAPSYLLPTPTSDTPNRLPQQVGQPISSGLADIYGKSSASSLADK